LPEAGTLKYLVKLRFEVDGIVDKADVIGAIFGQTEGLLSPELNLNELQKSWKVGRIEISLENRGDKTLGEVLIPMSTDIATAALIAASVESIEKVGPFQAKFVMSTIEDVRAVKKKQILERAKAIVRDWSARSTSETEDLLSEIAESMRKSKVVAYGKDELAAGPGIYTSDTIILVEGRADVINLLRAGIENAVAIEGVKIPESVKKLTEGKRVIAFLDGDRAGDLILRELQTQVRLDAVVRAPEGREVEELTPLEILDLLKNHLAPRPPRQPPAQEGVAPAGIQRPILEKAKELFPSVDGTLEAVLLDQDLNEIARVPVSELVHKLESTHSTKHVVFDGVITARLVDVAKNVGVESLIAQRVGELPERPRSMQLATFRDLGLR
jgi:DNA primase